MKARLFIALLAFAFTVSCTSKPKASESVVAEQSRSIEGPSLELSAIDSLMWRQPDSALALLQRFAVSPEADNLDEFNGHYCQLLISELLYKNYAAQTNREELLQAVAYFDSLVRQTPPPPLKGDAQRAGDLKKISNLTPNLVFLDARAHYINGAGYYEKDSVVNACAEYLKALEVMEEQFEEKALTGKNAVFMFYIYNRLLELFSAQFMMDPALTCGENALAYCRKDPSLSKVIPNTYLHIGKQYDKKGEIDIARCYYEKAIEEISDTNSPIYRDAISMKALCDYQLGLGAEQSLNIMKQSLVSVTDDGEKVVRFLVIGSVYSEEGLYDSALRYFELAFENRSDVTSKIRAAESIRVVYDSLGDREKANEFMRYLADHKESEGENKALTSRLEGMFKNYQDQKQKEEAEEMREKSIRKTVEIIVPIAIMVALTVFIVVKLRSKKQLKQQHEEAEKAFGEKEQEHEEKLRQLKAETEQDLEDAQKNHEETLKRLQAESEQHLAEAERKHQQWMADAEERLLEELRIQKDRADKEMEKTKKRHEKELEAERLAYRAEMAEKEAKAQTERRLHEETLTRHQVETEQRMSEAERKHRQKMEEIARKHELEMQAQHDKTEKEAEQTRKRHASELEAVRLAHQQEMEAKAAEAKADRERHEEELRRRREQAEQRLAEAEQDHQRKVAELAKRQEEETRRQQEKMEQEREQAKKRYEAELEAERMAYQAERETLRQSLRQREAKINALEKELNLQRIDAELQREEFLKEPVCGKINDSVRSLHITAREGSKKNVMLTEEDAVALKEAVLKHYPHFETVLLSKNPKLSKDDLLLCYLYLLGMDERQIAALMCKTYSAIKKRSTALKVSLALEESLSDYILKYFTF